MIGCDDPSVAVRVSDLYKNLNAPILVTDPASAEMIKYASNAFLATKISFVNAIANLCEAVDADVREVALGMGYDQRIGFEFLHPGPGLRRLVLPEGHRRAALHGTQRGLRLLAARGRRRRSTSEQHERMVDQAARPRRRVARGRDDRVLGPHVQGQHRRPAGLAGARTSCKRLLEEGRRGAGLRPRGGRAGRATSRRASRSCPTRTTSANGADVLAVLTEWDEFRWMDFDRVAEMLQTPTVLDARNLLDPAALRRLGFTYEGVGR